MTEQKDSSLSGDESTPETVEAPIFLILGLVSAVIAFVGYALTLSDGAYPGRSADYIVRATGLAPLLTPLNPLWNAVAGFVARVGPGSSLAWKLNIFSASCAAIAVLLLYRLVTRGIYAAVEPTEENCRLRRRIACLAGMCASLVFAFSMPIWIAGNRAHPASFQLLLLLTLLSLFVAGCSRPMSTVRVFVLALACGVCVVEFATVALFLPICLLALTYSLFRQSVLSRGRVLAMALGLSAGLSTYIFVAMDFARTPSYGWHDYDHVGQVIWYMWRDQFRQMTQSLPSVGWLVVIMMTVVPAVYALLGARTSLNNKEDWSRGVVHGVLSIVIVACVANAKISPWYFVKHQSLLVVTPYLLVGATCGYLLAYWSLLPLQTVGYDRPNDHRRQRTALSYALASLWLAIPIAAIARNFSNADARSAAVLNSYADQIVTDMGERTWLVSDGGFDSHVVLRAHDRGRQINVLNMRMGRNAVYRRYIESLFEDDPLLRSRAAIGLAGLLAEWFEKDPDVGSKVATLVAHDFWLATDLIAVPCRTVIAGTTDAAEIDLAELHQSHQSFWAGFVPRIMALDGGGPRTARWVNDMQQKLSLIANNLGVFLEDSGRPDSAFSTYEMAREIDPQNLSSLLNMGAMIGAGYQSDRAAKVSVALQNLLERSPTTDIWSLSARCGYVRLPSAYAQLGWSWVRSGQSGAGIASLQKAVRLRGERQARDPSKQRARELTADAYLESGDVAGASSYYQAVLDSGGDPVVAQIGLARVEAMRGDPAKSLLLLDEAEESGAPKGRIVLEKALVHIMVRQLDHARTLLSDLVEVEPENARAWAMLVGILLDLGDVAEIDRRLDRLQRLASDDHHLSFCLGRLAEQRGDLDGAMAYYSRSLLLHRANVLALSRLMALSFRDGEVLAGERWMRQLLTLDPENALGNYALGKRQMAREQYRSAEDSFRRSLRKARLPRTLNDLAWVLSKLEAYDEASACVREALDLRPDLAVAWDTYGVVLTALGKWQEAETALNAAIAIRPDNLRFHMNLARLYLAKGDAQRARQVVTAVQAREDDLSSEDRGALHRLERDL